MPAKKKAAEASASQEEDVSMVEASMVENGTPEAEDEITVDDHRIRIVSFIWSADLSYTCWPGTTQLPGSSETAASFEFKDEDHTLGNALRYIIMKKYVPPCPGYHWLFLRPKFYVTIFEINVADSSFLMQSRCRILRLLNTPSLRSTYEHPNPNLRSVSLLYYSTTQLTEFIEGTTAVEALEKGFDDLMDLCDVVVDKFVEARDAFEDQMKE